MIKLVTQTREALADGQLQKNLKHTLGHAQRARDAAVAEVANWEALRQHAHDVKAHTLAHLDRYLEQLEEQVLAQGGQVIWAQTAQEAVEFVLELAHRKGIRKAVKSKSMLAEEIHLNPAMEKARIDPVETDLGEYIIQLAHETPSHIIAPALHKSRQQIGRLFADKLGMPPSDDVEAITATARRLLRDDFLSAPLGITGVNFGVAETGSIVVVENEGNARLTVSAPSIHVALMGVEKVIPRAADLAVFLKVLCRSATGQHMTGYVNFINGPKRSAEVDGPEEFYLVLVDNGRINILQDEFLRQTLNCIRCGACLTVCPVYQRVGGHAYQSTYPGPIGAILTPQLLPVEEAPEHPYASSLCGACHEVCPVKIEIPHILLKLREQVQQQKNSRASRIPLEKWALQIWSSIMTRPRIYSRLSRWARTLQRPFQRNGRLKLPFPPFNRWTERREFPAMPGRSFRELLAEEEEPQ